MSGANGISWKEIERLSSEIWSDDLKLVMEIIDEAKTMLQKEYPRKRMSFMGKNKIGIVAGLLYLLGFQKGAPRTLTCFSQVMGVSIPTISKASNIWVREFPALFPDFRVTEETIAFKGMSRELTWIKRRMLINKQKILEVLVQHGDLTLTQISWEARLSNVVVCRHVLDLLIEEKVRCKFDDKGRVRVFISDSHMDFSGGP